MNPENSVQWAARVEAERDDAASVLAELREVLVCEVRMTRDEHERVSKLLDRLRGLL